MVFSPADCEPTCFVRRRHLTTLNGLQVEREHENITNEVEAFLHGDGPRIQQILFEGQKPSPFYIVTTSYLWALLLT